MPTDTFCMTAAIKNAYRAPVCSSGTRDFCDSHNNVGYFERCCRNTRQEAARMLFRNDRCFSISMSVEIVCIDKETVRQISRKILKVTEFCATVQIEYCKQILADISKWFSKF